LKVFKFIGPVKDVRRRGRGHLLLDEQISLQKKMNAEAADGQGNRQRSLISLLLSLSLSLPDLSLSGSLLFPFLLNVRYRPPKANAQLLTSAGTIPGLDSFLIFSFQVS
jgi:hypothetical protein